MTLIDWFSAGDIADREIEEAELIEWVLESLRHPGSRATLSGRTGAGTRSTTRRKRRWSRARIRKAIERWLTLLGPFAALAAAILALLK